MKKLLYFSISIIFLLLIILIGIFFEYTELKTRFESSLTNAYKKGYEEGIQRGIPEKYYERYFIRAEQAFESGDYAVASYLYQEYINAIEYARNSGIYISKAYQKNILFKRKIALNRKMASELLR